MKLQGKLEKENGKNLIYLIKNKKMGTNAIVKMYRLVNNLKLEQAKPITFYLKKILITSIIILILNKIIKWKSEKI